MGDVWWCPHSDTFNKYFVCYGHLTDYQFCTTIFFFLEMVSAHDICTTSVLFPVRIWIFFSVVVGVCLTSRESQFIIALTPTLPPKSIIIFFFWNDLLRVSGVCAFFRLLICLFCSLDNTHRKENYHIGNRHVSSVDNKSTSEPLNYKWST